MGTHSLIYFDEIKNDEIKTVIIIYQHSDGYPGYVGLILANFLKNMRMVSAIGYPIGTKMARRYSCLVAQYIAQQKDSVGEFYIETAPFDVEWIYRVRYNEHEGMKNIKIIVESSDTQTTMSIDEFQKYCYYHDNENDENDINILVQNKIDKWKLQRSKRLQLTYDMLKKFKAI